MWVSYILFFSDHVVGDLLKWQCQEEILLIAFFLEPPVKEVVGRGRKE